MSQTWTQAEIDARIAQYLIDNPPAGSGDFVKATDDTDDITEGAIKKFATAAEKTKLGFITVTQAVDLDTIESNTATNNAKVSNATHTGDVTGDTALTIANLAVTNAKMAVGAPYVHVSTSSGATTTGANTTPVDVTGAVFTYVANAVYRIWVMGRVNSAAATTGIGVHFNVSTAITDINVISLHPLAVAGTVTGSYSISDDASEGVSSGVPAGPLDVPIWVQAIFRPGNNTGTCQLRVRSETTAVTELMAGATMVVERLS